MKNKIVSITIALSFAACILCTPVHIFLQNFCESGGVSLKSIELKGVAANIVLSADKIARLDDFTQNIKTPKKKIFDFEGSLALFSKDSKQKLILEQNGGNLNLLKAFDISSIFYFADLDRHRLRTHTDNHTGAAFILFILLYIGMLRAVYLNKKTSLLNIEKPLFA